MGTAWRHCAESIGYPITYRIDLRTVVLGSRQEGPLGGRDGLRILPGRCATRPGPVPSAWSCGLGFSPCERRHAQRDWQYRFSSILNSGCWDSRWRLPASPFWRPTANLRRRA